MEKKRWQRALEWRWTIAVITVIGLAGAGVSVVTADEWWLDLINVGTAAWLGRTFGKHYEWRRYIGKLKELHGEIDDMRKVVDQLSQRLRDLIGVRRRVRVSLN